MGVLCENGHQRGYGLVVEHVLAKDETGVRFSLSAPNSEQIAERFPGGSQGAAHWETT